MCNCRFQVTLNKHVDRKVQFKNKIESSSSSSMNFHVSFVTSSFHCFLNYEMEALVRYTPVVYLYQQTPTGKNHVWNCFLKNSLLKAGSLDCPDWEVDWVIDKQVLTTQIKRRPGGCVLNKKNQAPEICADKVGVCVASKGSRVLGKLHNRKRNKTLWANSGLSKLPWENKDYYNKIMLEQSGSFWK